MLGDSKYFDQEAFTVRSYSSFTIHSIKGESSFAVYLASTGD